MHGFVQIRIESLANRGNGDHRLGGQDILDLNLDYLIRENIKLRFTANNLTDERRGRYWFTPGRYYSDLRDNGRSFVLELRITSN